MEKRALGTWTGGGSERGREVEETDKERDAEKGFEEVFASLIRQTTLMKKAALGD